MKAKKLLNLFEYDTVYSKAVSLGYPYIRGQGKSKGGVWMTRFTKDSEGRGKSVYVGWNPESKEFVVEYEEEQKTEAKVAIVAAHDGHPKVVAAKSILGLVSELYNGPSWNASQPGAAGPGAMTQTIPEEKTPMICRECGHRFKKTIGKGTFEVKCPKCGSFDTDIE